MTLPSGVMIRILPWPWYSSFAVALAGAAVSFTVLSDADDAGSAAGVEDCAGSGAGVVELDGAPSCTAHPDKSSAIAVNNSTATRKFRQDIVFIVVTSLSSLCVIIGKKQVLTATPQSQRKQTLCVLERSLLC